MPLSGWSDKRALTIDNTAGAALTNYQVRVRLTASNFNFAHAKSDGSDLRFLDSDNATNLSYWIDTYDSVNQLATVWVKVPSIGAATSYTIYLYYGNAGASAATDSTVLEYYNALSSAGDLADLASSFGTATWSVVTDAGSPTGSAVSAVIGTANNAAIYKALALPTEHAASLYVSDAGAGSASARAGTYLNLHDSNNWLRGGSNPVAGAKDIQVFEDAAGTSTLRDVQTLADAAGLSTSTYYRQLSIWKKKTVVTYGTTFNTSTQITSQQGCVTDGTSIWVCGSNTIARYNMSGVSQENVTNNPGGAAWADMHLNGGTLYLCRFDDTTPATKIYSMAPANLAGGVTLVADVTSHVTNSCGGLVFDGTHWLLGQLSTSATNINLYVFDSSWNFVKSIVAPIYGGATNAGIQALEIVGTTLYATIRSGRVLAFQWDKANLEIHLSDVWDTTLNPAKGIAWDSANSRWYLGDNTNNLIKFATLSQDATARTASVHFPDAGVSVSDSYWSQASPVSQVNVGVGGFRTHRLAKFFVRKHSIPEPLAVVGAEQANGAFSFTDAAGNAISALPSNHGSGSVTIKVVGSGTTWSGATAWSVSGVAGWSLTSATFVDTTHFTLVLGCPAAASPPAGTTGTLTVTDTTDTLSATIPVSTPTLTISPTGGNTGTTPTLTLTGANTLWSNETAAGLFTETGGTGASIATPTVTNNSSATAVLTVGSATGSETIKDTSTGATATFTATSPGPPTAGTSSLSSVTSSAITVTCTAATGGTSPYTYQWYRSTTADFTPGAGNLLTGATTLTYADTTAAAGTFCYYRLVVTDSASQTAESNQIAGQLLDATLSLGYIGDSITIGYVIGEPASPPENVGIYLAKWGKDRVVNTSNQGVSGTTTGDWISGSTNLTTAKTAFAAMSPVPTYIHVMLGANDAKTTHVVSAATYQSNLQSLITDLTGAGYKIILSYPIYSPSGANGDTTDDTSTSLIRQYMTVIDGLVNNSTVFAGDKLGFAYFADHLSELQADQLHPTVTGAQSLGLMWAKAIDAAINPVSSGTGGFPVGSSVIVSGTIVSGA